MNVEDEREVEGSNECRGRERGPVNVEKERERERGPMTQRLREWQREKVMEGYRVGGWGRGEG